VKQLKDSPNVFILSAQICLNSQKEKVNYINREGRKAFESRFYAQWNASKFTSKNL